MSVSLTVILESGPVPDEVVPPDQQSCGQNVVLYMEPLAALAAELGVAPLDTFIVDWCGLVETALSESGWREPAPPAEWGNTMPLDGRPSTDPAYLAALAEADQIAERVHQELPWYPPADGLATVCGLIAALDASALLTERLYGAVWDLRAFRFELEYAERLSTRFHFGVSY